MMSGDSSWEREYSHRGKIWGGVQHGLPAIPPASRVLELGCGNGKTLSSLLGQRLDITAIDLSPAAVALAGKVLPGGSLFGLAVADCCALPFHDRSFDAVFAIHVLGHLPAGERKVAVSEIFRVLKDDGFFIFRGFSTGDYRFGKGAETEPGTFLRGTGIRTHYFGTDEVIALASPLVAETVENLRWCLRVRGEDLPREEIAAVFRKKSARSCVAPAGKHFKTGARTFP